MKYNKPLGVVCSMKMKNEKGRLDLTMALPGFVPPWLERDGDLAGYCEKENVPEPWLAVHKYHPVGRLDRDTSGLLLLSSDGKFTNKLLNPVYAVQRSYMALVKGDAEAPGKDGLSLGEILQAGVRTSEGIFSADVLDAVRLPAAPGREDGVHSKVTMRVAEGKYRMVRRMLYSCGLDVLALKRISYGPMDLGELAVGCLERSTPEEEVWANRFTYAKGKATCHTKLAEVEPVNDPA